MGAGEGAWVQVKGHGCRCKATSTGRVHRRGEGWANERTGEGAIVIDEARMKEQKELAPSLLASNHTLPCLLVALSAMATSATTCGRLGSSVPRSTSRTIEGQCRVKALLQPGQALLLQLIDVKHTHTHVPPHRVPAEVKGD